MQLAHCIIIAPFIFMAACWLTEVQANNKRAKRIARTNYGRYA